METKTTNYDIYKVIDENGGTYYGEDSILLVNGCIHLGLDCELYAMELDKPLDDFELSDIVNGEWEYVESYHA